MARSPYKVYPAPLQGVKATGLPTLAMRWREAEETQAWGACLLEAMDLPDLIRLGLQTVLEQSPEVARPAEQSPAWMG